MYSAVSYIDYTARYEGPVTSPFYIRTQPNHRFTNFSTNFKSCQRLCPVASGPGHDLEFVLKIVKR